MSRYSSLCVAINLVEACDKLMSSNGQQSEKTADVVKDLRDIAKDVRYGGQWHGDYEVIATALGCCKSTGRDCGTCPYRKIGGRNCVSELKTDAAAVIRHMTKEIKTLREELNTRRTAAWQRQDMANGNEPPDIFPWDDDEDGEMAPAGDGMGAGRR